MQADQAEEGGDARVDADVGGGAVLVLAPVTWEGTRNSLGVN